MRVAFSLSCLMGLSWVLAACDLRPSVRSNEGILQPKAETLNETIPSQLPVEFQGVSFTYDPRVFGNVSHEVKPECRLKEPDNKPDFVAPEHIRFVFERGGDSDHALLEVYPLDGFPNVYSKSPHYVEYMKKEIEGLRKVIKNPAYRLDGRIPRLPFEDVGISFYERVREFDFRNGDGVIFITHWTHGADLISNMNLLYRFEGITADGRFYVTGETPVSVAFLPDSSPNEFEGYTYDNLWGPNAETGTERIEKYRKSITDRLRNLDSNEFSPPLDKFEAIIASLEINK